MSLLTIIIILLSVCAALLFAEIWRELHSFTVTRYKVKSKKLNGIRQDVKIIFLSDLHNCVYGEKNSRLLQAVRREKPDLILIGGDMMVGKFGVPHDVALDFVRELPALCPVIYANGNHEQRRKSDPDLYGNIHRKYEQELIKNGVKFLENDSCTLKFSGKKLKICGLALGMETYAKFKKAHITSDTVTNFLGFTPAEARQSDFIHPEYDFSILLAHNPSYADAYLGWGADLILSGHLHGGLVRIPGVGGIITPQGFLFPEYSGEMKCHGNQTVIVSRGLGSHTLNVRLFNIPEIVTVTLTGETENTKKG